MYSKGLFIWSVLCMKTWDWIPTCSDILLFTALPLPLVNEWWESRSSLSGESKSKLPPSTEFRYINWDGDLGDINTHTHIPAWGNKLGEALAPRNSWLGYFFPLVLVCVRWNGFVYSFSQNREEKKHLFLSTLPSTVLLFLEKIKQDTSGWGLQVEPWKPSTIFRFRRGRR